MLRVQLIQHGVGNSAFNGTFTVTAVTSDKEFQHTTTDVDGKTHNVGDFTSDTADTRLLIYQDSKEMIYNQIYTSIEVK